MIEDPTTPQGERVPGAPAEAPPVETAASDRVEPGLVEPAPPDGDRAPGRTTRAALSARAARRHAALVQRVAAAAAQLGIAAPPVDTDGAAAQRVRARGATGLMSRGRVLVDLEAVDPDTAEGAYVAAHEVVHVAQIGLPKPAGAGDEETDAEAEAHELALALVQGGEVKPPVMPLAPGVEAADKKAKERAEKKRAEELTLPEGVPYDYKGGKLLVSRKWLLETDVTWEPGPEKVYPKITKTLLTFLRTKIYSWLTDERIEAASKTITLVGGYGDEPVVEFTIRLSALQSIGLPPNVQMRWQRVGDGLALLISSDFFKDRKFTKETVKEDGQENVYRVFDDVARSEVNATLEAYTKMQLREERREDWYAEPLWIGDWRFDQAAILIEYDAELLRDLFGKDRWDAWLAGRDTAGAAQDGESFSPGGNSAEPVIAPGVSDQDRAFYEKFMKEVGGNTSLAADGKSEYANTITSDFIALLREIDEHPKRDEIIAAMRKGGGSGSGLSYSDLRSLISQIEVDEAMKDLSGNTPDGTRDTKPLVDRPIEGKIVEQSGKLFPGEPARFHFEVRNTLTWDDVRYVFFRYPEMTVHWFVTPKDQKTPVLHKDDLHYEQFDPEYFEPKFEKPGEYDVHAVVHHEFYESAYFYDSVVVKTVEAVMSEMRNTAWEGVESTTEPTVVSDDYSFARHMKMPGKEQYHVGLRFDGKLPEDFNALPFDQRVAFFQKERDAVDEFVRDYQGSHKKDVKKWAEKYKKQLEEEERRIVAETTPVDQGGKGYTPFVVRATYVSRKAGLNDAVLNVIGTAKTGDGGVTIKLHDYSRYLDRKEVTVEKTEATFNEALEVAFVQFCKNYPEGRLALLAETLDVEASSGALKSTGRTLGFELDTHSKWEEISGEIFDGDVQLAVNIAATILMILFPAAAPIIFTALMLYNLSATINHLVDLDNKGLLDAKAVGYAIGEIVLDLLPFLGKAKFLMRASKHAWVGIELLEGIGQGVLMTMQARDALEDFHASDVRELSLLHQRIKELEKSNPSSTELDGMRKSFKKLEADSRTRGEKLFRDYAVQGAIMFAAPAVFTKIAAGARSASVDAMKKEGYLEVDDTVIEPYYDPLREKIVIGKGKIDDESLALLQDAYLRDVNSKRARLGLLLNSDKLEVKRVDKDKPVTVTEDGQGGYVVEVPAGKRFEDVLDDVWAIHKQKLGPGAVKPDIPTGAPTWDTADVLNKTNIVVGNPIGSQADGDAIMKRLSHGDASALSEVGLKIPEKFDPRSVEWGLGRRPDGSYVLVRGEPGAVDWGKVGTDLEPIAHSHPYGPHKRLQGAGRGGIEIQDLVDGKGGGGGQTGQLNRVKVLPSASDFRFAAEHDLSRHTVHTPYVHVGGKRIANPGGGVEGDPIYIVIARPTQLGSFAGNPEIPVYQAEIAIRAGDKVLWSGTFYAAKHPSIGDVLSRDMIDNDGKPTRPDARPSGTGGGAKDADGTKPDADPDGSGAKPDADPDGTTPDADPSGAKPDADPDGSGAKPDVDPSGADAQADPQVAERRSKAQADWDKLLKDDRPYRGKFTKDEFFFNYTEKGWHYDLDKRKWNKSGKYQKDPKKFSKDMSSADVYEKLAGKGSKSTFKPFAQVLIDEGIAKGGKAEIIEVIEALRKRGQSEDFIRHELKQHYRKDLLERIKNPDLETVKKHHPELKDATSVTDEMRQREMARILGKLDETDLGNIAEEWYRQLYAPTAVRHVHVNRADLVKQKGEAAVPKNLEDREIDLLDDTTALEVKTIKGKLPKDKVAQFNDIMFAVKNKATVVIKGKEVTLEKLRYVFNLAEGAKANLALIRQWLKDHEGFLVVEVRNKKGQMKELAVDGDAGPDLESWLGL